MRFLCVLIALCSYSEFSSQRDEKKSKTEIITQETTSQGTETVYKSNMNKCIFVIHVNELYVNKQLLTFLAFNFFFFT